jgi:radical SAM protein with 4Fe4S-binding SPASM domain
MLDFAQEIGSDAVILERFVPLGQGKALGTQYLKNIEWLEVIEKVIEFTNLDATPEDLLPYKAFHIGFKNELELQGALCNLGDESMALMPNGDIYPCRRLPLKIGNILKDDFNNILTKLKMLRESFDYHLQGICSTCLIDDCIGCRALTYALTNDLYASDPQCTVRV